jgi:hypothetical protein
METKPLVEPTEVLRVARQTVKALSDDDIKLAVYDLVAKSLETGALIGLAANGFVCEHLAHSPIVVRADIAAQAKLILHRGR